MDFIGKMETLEEDFKIVCEKIEIDAKLPHLNASRKDNNYLMFYSKNSISMIKDAFKEDIELFGYSVPEL